MRIIRHKLTGLVVILSLSTTVDANASPLVGGSLLSALASVGQADGGRLSDRERRQDVEELLRRAREAMDSGRLETAESLVLRAEALSVRFNLIAGLLRDTPKKARRDLDRLNKRSSRPKRPSRLAEPVVPRGADDDKNAAREGIVRNPFVEADKPRQPTTLLDVKSRASRYLAKGRRELSQGNIAAAKSWYVKATQLGASFDPQEDSPRRLLEDIRRSGGDVDDLTQAAVAQRSDAASALLTPDMVESAPQGPLMRDRPGAAAFTQAGGNASTADSPFGGRPIHSPPAVPSLRAPGTPTPGSTGHDRAESPRQQSNVLLLEARRALAAGDVKKASRFVTKARGLGVRYELHDDTPERVEALVQTAGGLIRRGQSGSATEAYRRELAQLLMQQSEGLLAWGDFDKAERMARHAAEINVNFGPFDATPQKLLDQIRARRSASEPQLGSVVDPSTRGAEHASGPTPATAEDVKRKQQVANLVESARTAVAQGDLERAEQMTRQAEKMAQPDLTQGTLVATPPLAPNEGQSDRGLQLLPGIANGHSAATRPSAGQAGLPPPVAALDRPSGQAVQGLSERSAEMATSPFRDRRDRTPFDVRSTALDSSQRANHVADHSQTTSEATPASGPRVTSGMAPLERGQRALQEGKTDVAKAMFQQAVQQGDEPSPQTKLRVEEHLTQMSAGGAASSLERPDVPYGVPNPLLANTTDEQQLLKQKLSAEIAQRQQQAARLLEENPKEAFELLKESRSMIETSGLDTATRQALLRRVHRSMAELEQYVTDNRARIALDARNRDVLEQIEYERQQKQEVDERLAQLVEEYTQLMHEQRFAEAELVARKVKAIAPDNPLSQTLINQSRFAMRLFNQLELGDMKEAEFVNFMESLEESSAPIDDSRPFRFPGPTVWQDLTNRRRHLAGDVPHVRSGIELEIENKLRTKMVLCQFQNAPLSEVIEYLDKMTGANLHVDLQGLAEEGVTTDEPVSLNLSEEISLKSALNLILQPLHLGYVIKDEVLKITSEQVTEGDSVTDTYNVVDLVLPIPNFGPNGQVGLAATLHDAYLNHPLGGSPGLGNTAPPWTFAGGNQGGGGAAINAEVLAQVNAGGTFSGLAPGRGAQILGPGPGGMGGGAAADFDTLINLITTTIEPDSWRDAGGTGDIESYPTTFSLVISTTEDTHRQIRDLLEQLRRLQDLQVTIEVRFISLNDNFFERIGIDFDFDLDDDIDRPFQIFGQPDPTFQGQFDNSQALPGRDLQDRDHGRTVTAGIAAPGIFSADLDIPFRQGSFDLAVPQFGGFDPTAGATIGFAILSDLEAFFFLTAAQGDRRSNVLQAPKVTLFNGQQASVFDISQSPFVISVIPVVGDFAAAQAPVIAILNEGTSMTVQAAVSPDRRFVRLTLVPYFSTITDRNRTFQFTGSTTTTSSTSSEGPDDATSGRANDATTTIEGTSVQLPTVAFISVATTVSVPDGGSVLLGGIKRLSEGRNEFGVPFLSKLPYVNRLFSNVSIGRETQSLMMMVTPRIIIQEEEEQNLLRSAGR